MAELKKRVYIETTIPSFYFEQRQEPDIVAMHNWTRLWWDTQSQFFEIVTSIAVIEELSNGEQPFKEDSLKFISSVPLLSTENILEDIVEEYIAHYLMPKNKTGDGLHLAYASIHRCNFLLTWNCKHLANANKFEHIRHINTMLGLHVPILTTPFELMNNEGVENEIG